MSNLSDEMPVKRNKSIHQLEEAELEGPSFSSWAKDEENEIIQGGSKTFATEEENVNSYIDEPEETSSSEEEEEEEQDEGVEEPEQDDNEDEDAEQEIEDEDDDDEDDDDEEDEDEDEDGDNDDEESGEYDNDEEHLESKKARKTLKRGGKKAEVTNEEEIQYGIESDDEDDTEFDKFDEATREQYLLDFHPESLAIDFDQVRAMCTLVRNDSGDIIDPFHKTIPVLTKYEKARILGLRAKQLNSNVAPNIDVPNDIIDGYLIAEMELKEKRIPFIIRRPLPNGTSEYWRLEDLEVLY